MNADVTAETVEERVHYYSFKRRLSDKFCQAAFFTQRSPGAANSAAVMDHTMAENRPFLFRNQLHQIAFDLHRVGFNRQSHAPAETADVRINGNAGHAEGVAQNDVRGLKTDAGQRRQFLHRGGHLSTMFGDELLTTELDTASFVAEEAGRLNKAFQLGAVGVGKSRGVGIAREQSRRHQIDAGVGALGRQDGGNEQLQRTVENESAWRFRIKAGQSADDAAGAGFYGDRSAHVGNGSKSRRFDPAKLQPTGVSFGFRKVRRGFKGVSFVLLEPQRAGLVADLAEYPWSSYGVHGLGCEDVLVRPLPV